MLEKNKVVAVLQCKFTLLLFSDSAATNFSVSVLSLSGWFSIPLCPKISHSEIIEQDIINLYRSSCRVPIILVRF